MLKQTIKGLLDRLGIEVRRVRLPDPPGSSPIPDRELYRPLFSPWLGGGDFRRYYELAAPKTLVSPDRCHVLQTLLRQALHVPGDVWECGVYKGGTAGMMAAMLKDAGSAKRLYLFDTFAGMPETHATKDWHRQGDFADTSVEAVTRHVGHADLCVIRQGFIPDTFAGLEDARIAFAHIDVDIYQSILDSLAFIWPRLSVGGFVVLDDYGFPTCPGARAAVDEFFQDRPCVPLCLSTGQAIAFKSVA
jgi:O-methyltransferase